MKKLVVFYSFEGNTKLIAENIAETINADIIELKPKKEIKSKGFMKYIWGGKQALMKTKPDLMPLEKDPQDYDVVFIGTPVWAWTFSPPLNTFFANHEWTDKKIALFCCHGGNKGKTFDNMKEALKGSQILDQIDFLEPLKSDTNTHIQRAKQWSEKVVKAV